MHVLVKIMLKVVFFYKMTCFSRTELYCPYVLVIATENKVHHYWLEIYTARILLYQKHLLFTSVVVLYLRSCKKI